MELLGAARVRARAAARSVRRRSCQEHEFDEAMEALSGASRAAYAQADRAARSGRLSSGSEPARGDLAAEHRLASGAAFRRAHACSDLRAIPWVFAWAQNRHVLTGWYGVGSGDQPRFSTCARSAGSTCCRRMFQESRLFRLIIDEVEKTLLRSISTSPATMRASSRTRQCARPIFAHDRGRTAPHPRDGPARQRRQRDRASAFRSFASGSRAGCRPSTRSAASRSNCCALYRAGRDG